MNHELFWPVIGILVFVAFTSYMIGRLVGERVQSKQTMELLGGIPLAQRYYELLLAVGMKYPGETRHQTALRYIQEAENRCNEPAKSKSGV